jgi:hypothetical protein
MKKLGLKLNDLKVESFPTVAGRPEMLGTVHGQQYATMPPCYVQDPPREPGVPSDSWRISDVCLPYTQNPNDPKQGAQ